MHRRRRHGAIFEAEHTATERRVALELLFPHITGVASARAKFELEARISARVNSPFIVEVLDAGFDESIKSPFLVMELLEGQTLAARIDEHGPLAPREALPLLQQVAAGLDAAHAYRDPDGTSKPILHRDLKPENLFLVRRTASPKEPALPRSSASAASKLAVPRLRRRVARARPIREQTRATRTRTNRRWLSRATVRAARPRARAANRPSLNATRGERRAKPTEFAEDGGCAVPSLSAFCRARCAAPRSRARSRQRAPAPR
jgi:hypothetical protein